MVRQEINLNHIRDLLDFMEVENTVYIRDKIFKKILNGQDLVIDQVEIWDLKDVEYIQKQNFLDVMYNNNKLIGTFFCYKGKGGELRNFATISQTYMVGDKIFARIQCKDDFLGQVFRAFWDIGKVQLIEDMNIKRTGNELEKIVYYFIYSCEKTISKIGA